MVCMRQHCSNLPITKAASLYIMIASSIFFSQSVFASLQKANDACAYACIDWTLGSSQMNKAEEKFKSRTGEQVHFGVGTFMGEGDDVGTDKHLGKCYRLVFKNNQTDIIAQVVNTGYDMTHPNQFDIQMGAGGMGAFNACAGDSNISMYAGEKSVWGLQYGGIQNENDCNLLPQYPIIQSDSYASNNLRELCHFGFIQSYRGENGLNYKFEYVPERVKCPLELTEITGFYRKDDPASYSLKNFKPCNMGDQYSIACSLTRMMDCAKPTAAWTEHVNQLDISGPVPACKRDGYSRLPDPAIPSAASSQCQKGQNR